MEDPKRQAWMYVGAGVVAVVAAIWFLTTDNGTTGGFSLLDWGILGMGVVALFRGVRMFLDLRRSSTAEGQTKVLPRPDAPKPTKKTDE